MALRFHLGSIPEGADVQLARRTGWLRLDAVLGGAPPAASDNGREHERSTQ